MNKQLSEHQQKAKRDAALRRQAKEKLAAIKRFVHENRDYSQPPRFQSEEIFDLIEQAGFELPL